MNTRIVLGDNVWFTVTESIDELMERYIESSIFKANVIDGYEIAIVKDKILCLVSVSVSDTVDEINEIEDLEQLYTSI